MGLFDFLKDVGANIFGGGDEAEEIQELLTKELGDKITDLKVAFDDDIVTLSGTADSQATKEKAVLLAGNIKGVAQVKDGGLDVKTTFYTVQPGDSLSKIAKRHYGDPMKYPDIFQANLEVIKDPDLIYPGQQLRIPAAQ